jgi:predicted ATPase/DNA-binding SARP family transcriptional activator
MDYRVLGSIEVVDGDRTLAIGGPRPRALLAVLVLEAGRPVSVARLTEELWGDVPPASATSSLHMHLSTLRRALGARLVTTPAGYVLEAAPDEVDAARFERAVADARSGQEDPGAVSAALTEALGWWRGPALDGIARGPTAAAAAVRLEELRLRAIEDRIEADLALGRHLDLLPELRGLVEAQPARERLAGQLMLALHRSDRGADALRVYDEVCEVLDRTLGVDPGDELAALARAIRRGDPTLARPGPGGLPLPTTSFVGRAGELAELTELLGSSRLVTLTGPGGCGKSRLGVELARAVAPDHPGGLFLVGLGGLAVTDSVTRAVASVLDARELPGEPLLAAIGRRLRRGRALVLLDDCERLLEECGRVCSALLQAVPSVRILTTSREPLGVAGEIVYRVHGLVDDEAVRLLAERAAAARPGLRLDSADAAARAICRHLDGLPLPIELAAARLRSLSPDELATYIAAHLDLLGGERLAAHERHRTIRATIDWSHALLDEDERRLFRRLAVFAGGFGAGPLEAIAAIEPRVERPMAVLAGLVDRSLVEAALRQGEPTRYRLLEVVRQFAAEQLAEAVEERAARAAHADWFARYASGARRWGGGEQEAWLHRVELDLDNVRAALGWYLGDGWRPERALQVVASMWWVWYLRGMTGESRTWLGRTLAATPPDPSEDRAVALLAAGAMARAMGDFAEALRLATEALDVQRELGDEHGQAAALNSLCITATALDDLDMALVHGERSLAIIERLGVPSGIAASRLNLGVVLRARGDLERPAALFEAAHAGFTEQGDRRASGAALTNLSLLAHRRGEADRARGFILEALTTYEQLGFVEGECDCLEVLAFLHAAAGDVATALRLLAVADTARERLGAPLFVSDELAARADAEAAIRSALDSRERAAAAEEAAALDLRDVVLGVLSGRGQPALER